MFHKNLIKFRLFLSNNNPIKQFVFHAITEFILLVFSIVIALQIDTNKEKKRQKLQEIIVLKNIQNDILLDTLDVGYNIEFHEQFLENEKMLLNFLHDPSSEKNKNLNFSQALGRPLYSILHQASFSNLQNNNLGAISNNSLKQEISRHYDFFVRVILALENDMSEYQTFPNKLPYFLKYFALGDSIQYLTDHEIQTSQYYNPNYFGRPLVLIDTIGAINDPGFKIIIQQSIIFRQAKIFYYTNFEKRCHNLAEHIDIELKKLE